MTQSSSLPAAAGDAGQALVAGTEALKQIVVAIHGIGDQYRYATIQSVVSRFGFHFDFPAAVPLGSFHAQEGTVTAFRVDPPPSVPPGLGGIGFVEIYWADIPRALQSEGYIIEETKAWARTVVERVRARYEPEIEKKFHLQGGDYRAAATVLEEMIETIQVLGNLLFIAEKAGVLDYNLDDLLTAYLGDVQVVADFPAYRLKILRQFRSVLDQIWAAVERQYPDAPRPEIHIVAHSEGTVIAFMALLQAMSLAAPGEPPPPPRPKWIDHVRGFMTIGSPIDKHLILWPSIWNPYAIFGAAPTPQPGAPAIPIKWRNYYDYGDPVGFELETARAWMSEPDHPWQDAFEFTDQDDFGFSRYLLPGAAHNDYWGDPAVFGHYIRTVMGLRPKAKGVSYDGPPPTRPLIRIGCYLIPYLLSLAILATGCWLLHKSYRAYLPTMDAGAYTRHGTLSRTLNLAFNALGTAFLIAGMTVAARIPRLTHTWRWKGFSVLIFLLGALLYQALVNPIDRAWLGLAPQVAHDLSQNYSGLTAWPQSFSVAWHESLVTIGLAALVALIAAAGWKYRERADWMKRLFAGMRPLMIPGALAVIALMVYRLSSESSRDTDAPLWPLLLSSAAFFYLWWLAALIFDLVFVWHRYMRSAVLQANLSGMRTDRKERERKEREQMPPAPDSDRPSPDPHLALIVICEELRGYLTDILEANGQPALDSMEVRIRSLFWQLEERDKAAEIPEGQRAAGRFVETLHRRIPWRFSLTSGELIAGDFVTVGDLLFRVTNGLASELRCRPTCC